MTRPTPASKALFGATLAAALVYAGCSPTVTTVDKENIIPPTALQYTINFQNQVNAIGSALVQVVVFDASRATDTATRVAFCQDLVDRRTRRRDFPADQYTQLADSTLVSPCELIETDPAKQKGKIEVTYGTRAVLVTAQKGAAAQDEILVGCGIGEVTQTASAESVITVSMQPFDRFTSVPTFPQCNRLADRCSGVATCPPR